MTTLTATLRMLKDDNRRDPEAALRAYINQEFPDMMKAFRIIDEKYSRPKQKGFNLVKRENKKHGFVYYVRYSHNGKMLPSKWNCRTSIPEEAERFARDNRERLVGRYLREHDGKGLKVFETFYREHSEYLASDEKRNRPLSDETRRNYHSVITKKFIPFMKGRNIAGYERIDGKALDDFQDHFLALGIKPQTVNDYMKAVKRIFRYLTRKGLIGENPCAKIHNIPVGEEDKIARGCYELTDMKGVFNKRWSDHKLYLLCLLIYTTGMRNSEIKEICMRNVISFGGCRFIDVKKSKTPNGIRLVPLHEKVYQKLKAYSAGKSPDEKVFARCSSVTFSEASGALGRIIRSANKRAEIENITFYSGRHFWKTLMNSEDLGEDVEEIFMGHKVSSDVKKLYNHRDKQGKQRVVKKAKKIFLILEKHLFAGVKRPARAA